MSIVDKIRFGLSIGNTLDCVGDYIAYDSDPSVAETAWGNPVVTKELVDAILATGINLIRVPVSWTNHVGEAPDYKISKSWMKRVKEIVDYAYDQGAYVILNVHHENWNFPYYDNFEKASERMRIMWTQIAEVFSDYDEHLIFEGQNEPRKIGTEVEWTGGDEEGWDVVNQTNKVFVETIRGLGGKHATRYLMLPGYAANSTIALKHLEIPKEDGRLIVSVHAYIPYPFALEKPGRDTWEHETLCIDDLVRDLKTYFLDQGIPVILGEFGAMNKHNEEERVEWAKYYLAATKSIGVPCVWWDNGLFEGPGENFGIFDRHTYEIKYKKLFQTMIEATK